MKNCNLKKSIFIGILIAVLAMILLCPVNAGFADALSYNGVEMSSLWYYGDSGLKIDSAKPIVDAWDKSKLSQKIIAVIDTGIDYQHEVFDGVLYENAQGVAVGYDSRSKKEVALDQMKDTSSNKHGNAIAGVIAIMIKELGLQDYVKIYPIKANAIEGGADKNPATFVIPDIVEAIAQAKRIGASAVNMSLGRIKKESNSWATDADLKFALEDASENSFLVAAAGNDGLDSDAKSDNIFYPAAHDGVFGVMAYNESGIYPDSNYGSAYDIASPGEHIYTAKYADGNTYNTDMQGTSLASPIVAFAGALLQLRYEADGKTAPKGIELSRLMRNLDCRTVKKGGKDIKCLDFNTVVTQDFSKTAFLYDDPTDIELSHNGVYGDDVYDETVFMRANNVYSVTFRAKINPYGKTDPALDSAIQWIVKRANGSETVKGSGLKFEYTPEYKDEIVTVIARLNFGSKMFEQEQDVFLKSIDFYVGEARVTFIGNAGDGVNDAPSGGILYRNEKSVFSLTGIEYLSESDKSKITWYVDGKYAGEGATFEYKPNKIGTHRISARYDDRPIPREFIATVKPSILRPLDLSMLIVGLVIAVAVVVVVVVIATKRRTKPRY